MRRKWGIFWVIFGVLMIQPTLTFGAVKVEWTATGSGSPTSSEVYWDTGFQTTGDWSLSQELTFFLRDRLAINSQKQQWTGSLDRCYLRYESGSFRLNLGRQAVSWGIGWFFRPTDLITPLTPLQKDDTRPGGDLAVLRWSTSPLTAVDLIAGEKLYAGRGELRLGDTNLRIIGVYQNEKNILGYDLQGGLAGFYSEAKYTWDKSNAVETGKLATLFGWRRMIWTDRQLYLEYLRDNSGNPDSKLYDYNLILTGQRTYLGQNYLAAGLQIPWDELTSFSITGVANLDDGGVLLEGVSEVQLTDNLDIRGMAGVLFGRDGTEFSTIAGGARWNLMVQVKYYF